MRDLYQTFLKLKKSKFRNSFKLNEKDKQYLLDKGLSEITEHAKQFVVDRLAAAKPHKDGAQTPYKGHPVFVAQHASATCCRTCISKWHGIPKGVELSEEQIQHIVDAIILWISLQDIG